MNSLLISLVLAAAAGQPLKTVDKVEIPRYLGSWYEIAKFPNSFQRNCVGAVATYSLRDDGDLTVVNSCREKNLAGETRKAKGKAWLAEAGSSAKLYVRFFWPFKGDYWIIDLGSDYEYAVVGEPGRKYLWILSRTAALPEPVYGKILERLREQGYDVGRLEKTPQPTDAPAFPAPASGPA